MPERLERLINLVIALRETRVPLTAEEIRRRVAGYGQPDHEAFRRMFERDKADLRALGVPIETRRLHPLDDEMGYRIDPRRYDLPAVHLAPEELAALAVAVQVTGLTDAAGGALRKLEVDADEPGLAGRVPAPGLGVDLEAPHRTVLMDAQLTHTTVQFTYRAPGREAEVRTVDPYALVHRRGRWYVIGHDHDRNARRAFRLDRIQGEVTTVSRPGAFAAPDEPLDVDAVVPASARAAPVTAEVAASPAVAWQVARRARGGGEPGPHGWTVFQVTGGDVDDLVAWALEFGPEIVVRAPAEVRAAVIDRLRALAA